MHTSKSPSLEDDGSEVSVSSSYTVVYTLKNKEWVVSGAGGWSEIHLYKDTLDSTYRLVGWTVANQDVLLNCNVTKDCVYKKKSDDFHKFVDENDTSYGLGFHKGPQASTQAKKFLMAVQNVIEQCKEAEARALEEAKNNERALNGKSNAENTGKHRYHSKSIFVSTPHVHERKASKMDFSQIPLGKLDIIPPKAARSKPPPEPARANGEGNAVVGGSPSVTDPWGIVHIKHATYDVKTRQYKGVPVEWASQLQKQFGLPPNQVETVKVRGFKGRIPSVLVQMKDYLFENGGLEQEGIFRLAPDAEESNFVKAQLNEGSFKSCKDVNCVANLIKVWFRDLPKQILSVVDTDTISLAVEEEDAARVLDGFPEPNKSIMLWLLDVCCEVTRYSETNLMTPQNLAIVIAPNLYHSENLDPMAALMHSQKVAHFLHKAICWRLNNPPIIEDDGFEEETLDEYT